MSWLIRFLLRQKRRIFCVGGAAIAATAAFEVARHQTEVVWLGEPDKYIAAAVAYLVVRRLLGFLFDRVLNRILGLAGWT